MVSESAPTKAVSLLSSSTSPDARTLEETICWPYLVREDTISSHLDDMSSLRELPSGRDFSSAADRSACLKLMFGVFTCRQYLTLITKTPL